MMAETLHPALAPLPYQCTHCNERPVQTLATIPYVRGLIVWIKFGEKTAVGCVQCVRRAMLHEVGLSALIGWFSPIAVFLNPFAILNGLFITVFVGRSPAKARRYLVDRGFPAGIPGDLTRVSYALATTMLGDEWTKAAEERSRREAVFAWGENFSAERVSDATRIGREIVPAFDSAEFELFVARSAELGHPLHIAEAAARVLSVADVETLGRFLLALSDGLEFPRARQDTFRVILAALKTAS